MNQQRNGYEVDFTRERLPMGVIREWLSEAYWSRDRSGEEVDRSWNKAAIVCGLYLGDTLVGCARVVTDSVAMAYLADVFVAAEHRGHGLGKWMVGCVIDHLDLHTVQWLLHTRDAHTLYERLGFRRVDAKIMARPRRET